jgi:PAS domain S-box-containing protein
MKRKPTYADEPPRGSERDLRRVMDAVPALIAYIGADFRYHWVNKRFEEWLCLQRQDIEGRHVRDVLGDEAWQEIEPLLETALTGGQASYERQAHYHRGETRWISTTLVPDRGPAGRVRGIVALVTDIGERKRAEEALRASEAQLRTVIEHSRDGINMLDLATGRYLIMSPAQVALTGFTAAEINNISAQEAYERVHPEDREISMAQQALVAAGEDQREPVEYRWKVKSGEYRWFSDSRTLVRDAAGRPVALVGVSRDITEKKRVEADLQESRGRFQVLIQNVDAGVALVDGKGMFAIVNPAFLRMFDLPDGADVREVNDREWSRYQVVDENGTLLDVDEHPVRKAVLSGMAVRDRLVGVRSPAADCLRWMLISAVPVVKPGGITDVTICTYHDISGQRAAEESLRRNENLLRALADNSPDAIFVKDTESRWLIANPAVLRLVGKTAQDAMGRTDGELFAAPGIGGALMENDRGLLAAGQPRTFEETLEDTEGRRRVFLSTKAPWRDAKGMIIGLVGISRDVTDAKRAEEALRRSEEKFSLAFASNPAAIAVTRLEDGAFLEVNDTWVALLGYSREEAVGMSSRTMNIWPSTDASSRFVRMLKEKGSIRGWEQEFFKKSGASFFAQLSAQLLSVGGEKVILSTLVDMTDRKLAEEAMRTALGRFQAILSILYGGVLVVGGEGQGRLANQAFCDQFRLKEPPAALEGLSSEDIMARIAAAYRDPDGQVRRIREIVQRGRPVKGEEVAMADGRTFLRDFIPIIVEGTTHGRLWHHLDITDRKRVEQELHALNDDLEKRVAARTVELKRAAEKVQAERKRLYDVLETLPASVVLFSGDHRMPFTNRFFRERFGKPENRRCHEFLYNRPAPCEKCGTFTVFSTDAPHQWEWTGPDGRTYDIHDFPFVDSDGSRMIMEMGIDITERRQAEQRLRAAHSELEQRAGQLRALAGELTLSEQRERRRMARLLHDHLQQLLVGAKFRAAILGRAGDELVRKGVAEIEAMLDGCIEASRSLTAELSPPILHEAGIVAGLQWLSRWMADKHGLIVDVSFEEDLPPLADDVKLLLFESVRELLFNAVKHAHAASAGVNARRIQGDALRVTVSDTGTGFDPAALKTAGAAGGGFGLFSIRERLDLVGGSLEIDSAAGKGSRFMLTVPFAGGAAAPVSSASRAAGEAPQRAEAGPALPGTPIRVLLADDHAVMREGLARLLGEEPDIEIVGQAADGQEAVELAARLLPDIVLMDMSMPRLNGVEATRAIRNDNPDIRVIGLSMFEESDRAQALRDAGAVGYLTKSGPPRELLHAIRAHAAGRPAGGGPPGG